MGRAPARSAGPDVLGRQGRRLLHDYGKRSLASDANPGRLRWRRALAQFRRRDEPAPAGADDRPAGVDRESRENLRCLCPTPAGPPGSPAPNGLRAGLQPLQTQASDHRRAEQRGRYAGAAAPGARALPPEQDPATRRRRGGTKAAGALAAIHRERGPEAGTRHCLYLRELRVQAADRRPASRGPPAEGQIVTDLARFLYTVRRPP